MTDRYIRADLAVCATETEVPRREFDLIEFYKEVKKKMDITMVEFDEESHIVSFHGVKKETTP